jgi:hypothetical protein
MFNNIFYNNILFLKNFLLKINKKIIDVIFYKKVSSHFLEYKIINIFYTNSKNIFFIIQDILDIIYFIFF